uniref:Uncharacterized protein n=1 Tax=Arcella intermedia TaxID=1963864 RepID=A0A6B2KZF2_9EUKA
MYNFTSMITTTQWATEHAGLYDGVKPAARAYHSAVITGKTEDMFIFGGESGGSYFSDLWRLSPVRSNNTYQWTQIFPSGAAPCARSGHEAFWAKTSSTTNDESGFYIFGGTNGTHVFNDLWYFSIATSSWTQVVPNPAQAPLSPRAYYSVVVWYSENNGSFAFMYGGIDSTLNVHDDSWSIISLSDIYIYCINNVRRRENCENVAESIVCSVSSTTPFKCNLDCFSTPIGCSSMFECPSNQTTCWDGTCKPSLSDCYPIQRCGVFQKRCSDGGCKAENDPSCQANLHCTPPLQLCADGSCSSSCPKYRGCLPDSKPILCADGSCASSSTACNAQCYPKISCYGGCFYDECPLTLPPPLFSLVDIPLQTRVIDDPLDCEDCNKTLLLDRSSNHIVGSGAPYTDGTPSPLTYFSTHVDPRIMESAGPYPTWTSQFNYSFFYTVAVNLTVSGNSAPGNISLFLEYFGPRTENPQQDKCVGTIVPWYWSMNDLSPRSAFINDSFVVSVKALIASTGSSPSADSDFFSIPNISSIPTPKYRWNCIFSAGWYVPSDFGSYQKYGIYFQNPMSGQVITIMATPSWETPWPPVDKPAHYAVLGVAAGVLVTVLTVVIIKAAHRET